MCYGFLHAVHLALRIKEAACDRIIQKRLAIFLELFDLLIRNLSASLLFVLEILALFAESLVLAPNLVVAKERVEALANLLEFRLVEDGLTKFLRL